MSAADQQGARPIAQGDLANTPFAHIVLYLYRKGLNGTLILDRGGYETKILFRQGRAIAARPIPRGAGLQDGLLELCRQHEGAYGFWEGDLVGEGSGVIRGTVDPLLFVAESLRGPVRDSVIAGVVDRYLPVRLQLLPHVDLRKLGLRGSDARAAEQLRAEAMLGANFIERSELAPPEARKLLYLLLITRQVAPQGDDSSAASGVRAALSSAPPPRASIAPSLRPPSSTRPFRTASDPGARVPRSSLPRSGSPVLSSIPAWQQLASRRPGSLTQSGLPAAQVPTPSSAPLPLEALDDAGKLRRAEQLAERRSFREAERIADDLIARDPKNPDYHALRAYVYCLQFTGGRPPRPLLDAIERALRLNEEQPRALYVKGLVYKRMGKQVEAIRCFQRALDADPKHLEAERELRLARMRRER